MTTQRLRWSVSVCLSAVFPLTAGAQVIRGTVTERGPGTPLAGALVTLHAAGQSLDLGSGLRNAVANQRGEYVIRAPGAGRYQVTVRRIGVRAYVSDTLLVADGETVVHDVTLDPFTSLLPRVMVTDRSVCTTGRDGERVAALWREAETALTVILVSSRDSTVQRRLVRFTRRLAEFGNEVTEEESHSFDERDGIGEPNFLSLSGDSLSQVGYWHDEDAGMRFYAPDAHSLLSIAFLRDHCFSLVERRRDRPGLVGLAFAPVRGRVTPDIRGTLWLDAASFELHSLDFDWTQLPWELDHERVGGALHFMRLPTGSWIVKNWTLTMPRPNQVVFRSLGGPRRDRLVRDGFGQEGGMILIHGLSAYDRPGTVTGAIVRAGKPLTGARVRLVGTPLQTVVDAQGRFRFDRVPPGVHAIVAEHRDFDVFGIRAAEQEFVLQEGGLRHVALRARGEREIADALCPLERDWRLPTLRVMLVDETSRKPIANTRLRLRWFHIVSVWHGDLLGKETRDVDLDATTDHNGIAMYCAIPSATTLTLGYPVDQSGLFPLHTFKLGPQENAVATVRAAPPE